jgi:hypothetical protein
MKRLLILALFVSPAFAATWSNGASIWLYSRSDGTVVMQSTSVNYGAGMQTGGGPAAPTNLTGVAAKGVTIQ